MNVLIIKNVPTEGPGTIEEYLRAEKTSYSIIDLSRGESGLDMSGFTHLVVLGGPMGGLRDGPLPLFEGRSKADRADNQVGQECSRNLSRRFPNQAFRYSGRVYALQFHIEVTPVIVLDWLRNEKAVDLNSARADSNRIYEAYRIRAMNFYRGFFKS